MFKEELINIVNKWSTEQLNDYIEKLEKRITDTRALITELKSLRKKKNRPVDTGARDGR